MQEEFHRDYPDGTGEFKLLYGWGTLNANVWLPSLSELVGYDSNHYDTRSGVYYSAMQGLNISAAYCVDTKGGTQLAYFKQFNLSGGGQRIWNACKQQMTWLRSIHCGTNTFSWIINGLNMINSYDAFPLTASHAVHPAVSSEQIPYRSEWFSL